MSAAPASRLLISTRHVSADGARVTPGSETPDREIAPARALALLRSFAALPAIELVDVEARIYLTGPQEKVAVQNAQGKLFVAAVPEAVNAAMERTPEEIIALLTANDPSAVAPLQHVNAPEGPAIERARHPTRRRTWRSSPAVLVVLALLTAGLAHLNFGPKAPQGITFISDAAKAAEFHRKLNGSYGRHGATLFRLAGGKLTGHPSTPDGTVGTQPLLEQRYRLGQRLDQIVLVLDNGAILEVRPDENLQFLQSVYPRLPSP